MGNRSQLRSVTCHNVTCHPTQIHERASAPARQAGTRFTYPGGMEGWVYLSAGYILKWFICPQTVIHPSSNHLIVTLPGVEPTTSHSQVWRLTVTPANPHAELVRRPLDHHQDVSALVNARASCRALHTCRAYKRLQQRR